MLFLLESEIPENKSVKFSLQYVFGVGKYHSELICKKLGISINLKTNQLKPNQKKNLEKVTKKLKLIFASELKKKNYFK